MSDLSNLNGSEDENQGTRTVPVWDFPTRIFHWTMAIVVLVAWVSSEAGGSTFWIHVYSGTLLIGFVVFRAIWGVIGSRYARFGDFVHSPETVKAYTRNLAAFRPPHSTGHNPLGGWMVIALLVVILLSVLTGMMAHTRGYTGPLAYIAGGLFDGVHAGFVNLLMILIFGHVVGVLVHGFITRENLPRAMVTGNKDIPEGVKAEGIKPVGYVRPLIALACASAVVMYFMR